MSDQSLQNVFFIIFLILSPIMIMTQNIYLRKVSRRILGYLFITIILGIIMTSTGDKIIPFQEKETQIYSFNPNSETFLLKTNYSTGGFLSEEKRLYSFYFKEDNAKKLMYVNSEKTLVKQTNSEEPKLIEYYMDYPIWVKVIAYPTVIFSREVNQKSVLIIPENSIIE